MHAARWSELAGQTVLRVERIGGGAAGTVDRLHLDDGSTLVGKSGAPGLDLEARSLALLREHGLPVPRAIAATADGLVMEDLGASGPLDASAERHAADLLAALHARISPDGRFGLHFDNSIGPLPQRNTWSQSWPRFFAEHRLLAHAAAAERAGSLPAPLARRIDALASRLGDLLPDRPAASLIHGDVWSGNVIAAPGRGGGGRIVGFIDPSPYYAHAEVELAFITLFATFGQTFFTRYAELRALDAGFWSTRRDAYLAYPLLVHVRLFGGSYVTQLDSALDRLGF